MDSLLFRFIKKIVRIVRTDVINYMIVSVSNITYISFLNLIVNSGP